MAALTEMNYATGYAEFAINDSGELGDLPTASSAGKGDLSYIKSIAEGSLAFEPDFTVHRLTPDGWVNV